MLSPDLAAARRLTGRAYTDVAGEPAGATQVERLVERYRWVAGYCDDRIVIEVACGTGQGLGLLRSRAKHVYGCDIDRENLQIVRMTYGHGMSLVQTDAHLLPFRDSSADVVILLETIYFLSSPDAFVREARRVLRPGGHCLISAINKDCPDFNPKHPLYLGHYGARDLAQLLQRHGLAAECFGIIPMNKPTLRQRAFLPIKQVAIRLNLIPETMQARMFLKRIVFGPLQQMPRDITPLAGTAVPPRRLSPGEPDKVHQVVMCAGQRP